MASSRPTSMIISSGVLEEPNSNGSKTISQRKDSQSTRSTTNQSTLPVNNITNAHSSSSSIDSAGARNAILPEKTSFEQMNSIATISSTTTDSDLESEQEEISTDDNNFSELSNLPIQLQKQISSRHESNSSQKNATNRQERLSRRVKHFQKLFKSEIPDEMPQLIDSYVCAYQGDILLQGKMYLTDRYLCFHSRIISYVTKHVYRWEQIENVTKERVAFIFPTAIGIQLKSTGKKIIYASFLQRDQAFDKILSICARFGNDTSSFQDEEENHSTQNGALRATYSNHRNSNEKMKKTKRDMHFGPADDIEQDDVLQMCLRQDKASHNKRHVQLIASKSGDDKQQSKKLINSDKKKLSIKNSNHDQILSSHFNENNFENNQLTRHLHQSKDQQKQTNVNLENSSVLYRQTNNTSLRIDRSRSRDQASSPTTTRSSSNPPASNSSPSSITNIDPATLNSNNDGYVRNYCRILLLSFISIIKLILEYFFLLYNQFRRYPIKTSFILLIFITILIFHSFYLIKLAYRIEHRLQSLHHKWPSTSMKNSLPSLEEF